MNSFRPGVLSRDVTFDRPAWPSFPGASLQPPKAVSLPAGAKHVRAEPVPAPMRPMQGDELLKQARLQAAKILQEAASEAEGAAEAARQEGFAAGHQEGLEAGRAELNELRQQVEQAHQQAQEVADSLRQAAEATARATQAEAEAKAQAVLAQARDEADRILAAAREEEHRRLDATREAVVDLAVAAAVRLVQGHLAIQPEAILKMVSAGLRRLKDTDCTVRVHPSELPLLEAQRAVLERELATGLLRLQPDQSLMPGDYVVQSSQGVIDARIEHQATQMRTALHEALGGTT